MKKEKNNKYAILCIIFLNIACTNCKAQKNLTGNSKVFHYTEVDKIPTFGNHINDLRKYINDNLKWPSADFGGEGSVILYFVVGEDGTISNLKVTRSLCDFCDTEALRIIKYMPKWKAGTIGDKPVNVEVYLPIFFSLK
jgi:periplasmic protein TonB